MEELCSWWLKLLLRPAASSVLVARVQVLHSRLISTERLSAGDLEQLVGSAVGYAARMRQLAGAGLGMLQALLLELAQQKPGRYLLVHAPNEDQCCLFRALPPDVEASVQVGGQGVVCSMPWCTAAQGGRVHAVPCRRPLAAAAPCMPHGNGLLPPPPSARAGRHAAAAGQPRFG